MPIAPPTTPQQTQTNVTLEQEQLNNFLGPVNGALGGLPVVERTSEYFAIYTGAGGTGPEIIDETAIFIKYLVDENGNVSQPSEDSDALYNLIQNFEVGKNLIVRNDIPSAINGQIGGKHKITAIGRQAPLLYSQTGSTAGANVSFLDFDSNLNQSTTPRMEGWFNEGTIINSNNQYNTVTNYNSPFYEPDSSVANFSSASGEYAVTSSAIGDTQSIQFKITVGFRITDNPDTQTRICNVRLLRDGVEVNSKEYTFEGTGNQSEEPTFNFEADPLIIYENRVNFDGGIFSTPDPIYTVQLKIEDYSGVQADFLNFIVQNQSPSPSNPIVNLNYWENNNGLNTWLTASQNLSLNYENTQNSQNVLDEVEDGFNFSPVITPFTPRPGDRIRFGYNKDNDYTIYEVIKPAGDVDGRLKLRLNTTVPTSVNLNNFVIHRTDSTDPVYIIIDIPKNNLVTNSNQFKGVLLPEYPTKKLKNNLDKIILDLKEKGLIPDEN
jgi:hypothetical protein